MRLFPLRLKADAGVIVLWGDQPAGVRRMDNADAGQPQEDESPEEVNHVVLREQ